MNCIPGKEFDWVSESDLSNRLSDKKSDTISSCDFDEDDLSEGIQIKNDSGYAYNIKIMEDMN